MADSFRVGIIGYGNMASAIVGGALRSGVFRAGDTTVYDTSEAALSSAKEHGMKVSASADELIESADVILVSVKPQQLADVFSHLSCDAAGKCFISIVAGKPIEYFSSRLPGAYIVRVMPNTPIMLGYGASAISVSPGVPDVFRDFAIGVFSGSGLVELIDEAQMDAVVAVNGSSPAYFFHLAELVVENAKAEGIPAGTALRLFAATMEGASHMLLDTGKSPEELRKQVCSPGGTTLAALDAMAEHGFDDAFVAGLDACTRRSKELGIS